MAGACQGGYIRIIEALKEIQSTTASNISREDSSESVDAMVEALKSSFALHLLPTSLTSDAEEFFTQHLTTAFNKLVEKQIKAKEGDYQVQVQVKIVLGVDMVEYVGADNVFLGACI